MYWLGLFGLLSVPVLIGVYFFRIRFPEKKVSSLFLWDFPETRLSRGMQRNKFINERSFWLELLALLLIVLLLLKVDSLLPSKNKHILFVLDNSFAMQAMVDGEPVYKRVVNEIEKEIKNSLDKVTIILADETPLILAGSVEEALVYLKAWKPSAVSYDWFMTKELIREISTVDTKVFVYSDRRISFEDFERQVKFRLLGASQANAYMLTAFREKTAAGYKLGVYAGYAGNAPRTLKCSVMVGADKKNLALEKRRDELFYGELELVSDQTPISLLLEDDALLADNHFYLIPEKRKIWRLELAINDAKLSAEVFKVLGVFKEILLVADGADCVVSDHGVVREGLPHLLLGLGDEGQNAEVTGFTGQYISEAGHPLLKDLDLSDFIIQGVKKSNQAVYPLVHKNGFVVFGQLQNFKAEVYFWNSDFHQTDFFTRYMWPLFWENALVHFSKKLEGLEKSNLQTGEMNSYFSNTPLAVKLVEPDGAVTELNGLAKQSLHLPLARKPGVYRLLMAEKELAMYQCNLVDPNGSYLLKSSHEELVGGNLVQEDVYLRTLHESNSLLILLLVIAVLAVYLLNVYLDFKREGQQNGI